MDEIQKKEYLRLILDGHVPSAALSKVVASPQDLFAAIAADEVFAESFQDVMANMRNIVLDAVYAEALGGDLDAQKEFLRRARAPDKRLMDLASKWALS